ncbi:MAG: multidrug transporter [Cyanobacteria bacterium DS2.3.42]|nr:multidrug transporter [Cyanobacteria bacterium DS2.3.42]
MLPTGGHCKIPQALWKETGKVETVKNVSKTKVILAFLGIYLIWGSTYLAIKFAIDTMPPFMMASFRFLTAGVGFFTVLMLLGHARPEKKHWLSALITGTLLLAASNGSVVMATKSISTGYISLLIAMVPVYVALLEWLEDRKQKVETKKILGLVLGTMGIVTLIGPQNLFVPNGINWFGIAVVMFGSLSWSVGTIYSRRVEKPSSLMVGIAMQMICGGAVLGLVSLFMGEHTQVSNLHISMQSILAVAYLIVFGSIIGYSSYLWLLDHVSASKVSTYAYVNPIVAIFLGWAFAGETISAQTVAAGGIILASVWLITAGGKKKQEAALVPCRVVETVGSPSAKGVCQTHEFSAAGSKRSA